MRGKKKGEKGGLDRERERRKEGRGRERRRENGGEEREGREYTVQLP